MYIDFKDPKKVGYKANKKSRFKRQKKDPKNENSKNKKSTILSSLFSKKKDNNSAKVEQDIDTVELLQEEDTSNIELENSLKIDYEENILDKIHKTINQQKEPKQTKQQYKDKPKKEAKKTESSSDILKQIVALDTDKKEDIDSKEKVNSLELDEPNNNDNIELVTLIIQKRIKAKKTKV